MDFKLKILFWVLGASIFFAQTALAYNVDTHAYLTDEVFNFYNRHNPTSPLSEELRPYLVDGSRREDDIPRWMNHFYDPVHDRGLTYDPTINPEVNFGTWQKSKDWAEDSANQNKLTYKVPATIASVLTAVQERRISVISAETDFTWRKAIGYWLVGEEEKAAFTLGHVIHLIEDASVPDHVRNDAHPAGSPYENWTARLTLNNQDSRLGSRLGSRNPVTLSNLSSYFSELAVYTNNNFYSADTIGLQSGYGLPQPIVYEIIGSFRFALNKDDIGYFNLFKQLAPSSLVVPTKQEIIFDSPDILSAYWSRLSTKAVQYGAGVVGLFFREVEKTKNDPNFFGEEPKSFIATVLEMGGSVANAVAGAVKDVAVAAVDFAGSLLGGVQEPVGEEAVVAEETSMVPESLAGREESVSLPVAEEEALRITLLNQRDDLLDQVDELTRRLEVARGSVVPTGGAAGLEKLTFPIPPPPATATAQLVLNQGGGGQAQNVFSPPPADSNVPSAPTGTAPILISEVMAGAVGAANSEWIELYNPTDQTVSLAGWSLKRRATFTTTTTTNLVSSVSSTATIAPRGFFLIASRTWSGDKTPDAFYSQSSSHLAQTDDVLLLYSAAGGVVDEVSYSHISFGESLERRAWRDGTCLDPIPGGAGEFLGNGCDRGVDADDFMLRPISSPQNTASFPEPRAAPSPPAPIDASSTLARYSTSALSIAFTWQPSADFRGATSTVRYRIYETNATSTLIADTTSTVHTTSVVEVGRSYAFEVRAIDEEGLGSASAATTVTAPSFLKNLSLFRDPRAPGGRYLLEMQFAEYPFVPPRYSGGGDSRLVVFYLNRAAPREGSLNIEEVDAIPASLLGGMVSVRFKRCDGFTRDDRFIVFPDTVARCMSSGPLSGDFALDQIENLHTMVSLTSSTADLLLSEVDYVTAAFYDRLPSAVPHIFSLVAVDAAQYHFASGTPAREPPEFPDALQVTLDRSTSRLAVSWGAATDPDTIDNLLTYEVNFSSSTASEPEEGKWVDVGNILRYERPVAAGDSFLIGVHARDEFGVTSTARTARWSYPETRFEFVQDQANGWSWEWGIVYRSLNDPYPASFQSFVASTSFSMTMAAVRLKEELGEETATIRLAVYPSGADGNPDFTSILGLSTLNLANPDSAQDVAFSFETPVSTVQRNRYWLMLDVAGYANMEGFFRNQWRNAVMSGPDSIPDGEAGMGTGRGMGAECEGRCSYGGPTPWGPHDWYMKLGSEAL